jgi:hypothetical protein
VEKTWPLWFPGDHDRRAPVFVKRGGVLDLLDYGVSRGRSEDLLRLLAGIGSDRRADVVLSGAVSAGQLAGNLAATRRSLADDELEELRTLAEPAEAYWAARGRLRWA